MIRSMTGFASVAGISAGQSWLWEIRGVNARGLDLRLRLPDGCDGVEGALRAAVGAQVTRGAVTVSLRIGAADAGAAQVDMVALAAVLDGIATVTSVARGRGVAVLVPSATDILGFRGVWTTDTATGLSADLIAAVTAAIPRLLDDFNAMRTAEGAALDVVLTAHLTAIAADVAAARSAAAARAPVTETALRSALDRVRTAAPDIDPARIAQELALIAVKADVTEELDRLEAHIGAARTLLAGDTPPGRKLDFLAQEFNREANTLCAKAGSTALTAIGLSLKALIDQMREQVQNVE